MMTRRKWYTHDFLAESQKLLEKAPTSKDADLTPPAEGMSNINKYPEHFPYFAYYVNNPLSQSLIGVDGLSYELRGRSLGRIGQAGVPANLPDHPVQSIALDMLYQMHFAHLR
ncbi:uncharacterized protein TNCV_1026011 [Trichonephila clavipes]|nr:uncharacterized protein TNCV_1026011 [Trichonephila clavipes]